MGKYFKCEFMKIRKMYFFLIAAVFVLIQAFLSFNMSEKIANNNNMPVEKIYAVFDYNNFVCISLPLIVIIILTLYENLERSGNGWKMILINDGKILNVVISKLLIIYIICGFAYIVFTVAMCVPLLGIENFCIDIDFIMGMLYSYIGTLFNVTLLFLIFHLFKSTVVSLTVGLVGFIVNDVVMQTDKWKYVITTYYININSENEKKGLFFAICAASLGVLFVVTCFLFKRFVNAEKE